MRNFVLRWRLLPLCLIAATTGCGTVIGHVTPRLLEGPPPLASFSGVRIDCVLISRKDLPWGGLFALDLPFSVAGDLLFLPFDVVSDIQTHHLRIEIRFVTTDAQLEHVEDPERVKSIIGHGAEVTDAGMKYLKQLKGLKSLNLYGTQVTDAGLKYLKDLKNLQRLDLEYTKVTDVGVAMLRKALPGCNIIQ